MIRSLVLAAAAAAGVVAGLPLGGAAEETSVERLTLATGGPASVYHPIGAALAEIWSREVPGVRVEAEPTGGSMANLRLMQMGRADLAIVQNDVARYAFAAEAMFAGGPALEGVRGLATLYPEPVQVVALRGSGIGSIVELDGRRVAVGARGSAVEANARQILAAYGLDYRRVRATPIPFEDAAVALRDGLIHAAFLTAGAPEPAVARLTSVHRHDIVLLPIAPAQAEAIRGGWPFYTAVEIPAGTYASVPGASSTVAVQVMLVARADLDAGVVGRLLEVLYRPDTLTRLCRVHARGCDIVPASVGSAMPIPIHDGARAFYGLPVADGG